MAPGALALAATAPGESPSPDPNSADYIIGVEDVIQISVWKNADLSVTVPVRPDGKISLPLIDDVQAAGLKPLQLKEELTRRWQAFLSAPEVSVIVKEVNSFKVYLVGEVAKPGELLLKGPTRLLQAISLAGGLTTFANKSSIVVLRDEAGVPTRHEFSYKRVISGKRPEENILLKPGDTIVVP
jgi:polysaccharide biosynthesis/export protein